MLGNCKLCRCENVDLRESHYVPAALYPKNRKLEQFDKNGLIEGRFEFTDYLLCARCEQRFSERGESHVLGHIAAKIANKPNPLAAKLQKLKVQEEDEEDVTAKSYCADDAHLDMDMFAYFALSMFWRGTHAWPKQAGGFTKPLTLGLYTEPIRAFLAGETMQFPAEVAVIIIVCTDKISREVWLLPAQIDDVWFHDLRFPAFGVMFRVLLGRSIPDILMRNSCHLPARRIHMGDTSEKTQEAMRFSEPLGSAD